MELETVALEISQCQRVNSDEGKPCYDDYLMAKEIFQKKLTVYQALVAELKSKRPISITSQEMERADALAEEIEFFQKRCLEMKNNLLRKLECMILESKEMEKDLANHAKQFKDEEKNERVRLLLRESLQLKINNEPIAAIEKAFQAKELLTALLEKANSDWVQQHQEKVEALEGYPCL
jgi:hypothetical protein